MHIGKTIHQHPTLGESIGMAAKVAHGSCTDVPPARKSFTCFGRLMVCNTLIRFLRSPVRSTPSPFATMKHRHLLPLAVISLVTIAQADQGMLRITTDTGGAQIFINGQRKGNSPSQEGQSFAVKLPQGDYTLEARKSDGKDYYGRKAFMWPMTHCKPSTCRLKKSTCRQNPMAQPPMAAPCWVDWNGYVAATGSSGQSAPAPGRPRN
jgi:hypothetical protein